MSHQPNSDVMCPGNSTFNVFSSIELVLKGHEHTIEVGGAQVQPSHCTLPMFHPVMDAAKAHAGIGYVSSNSHYFTCSNPMLM
jgi:hypothetical protein